MKNLEDSSLGEVSLLRIPLSSGSKDEIHRILYSQGRTGNFTVEDMNEQSVVDQLLNR